MAETEIKTLSAIFDSGFNMYSDLESSNEPSNSNTFQDKVKKAVLIFEDVTRKVSSLNIFGSNEELEEIPTEDVRFLLLPALIGSLTLKLHSTDRRQIIDVAEVYYKDFLKRCRDYGISHVEIPSGEDTLSDISEQFSVLEMSRNRDEKIKRYKEKKQLQEKVVDLKKATENGMADEEVRRDYYITLIKLWITQSLEELASIDMEKPILEHMAIMKSNSCKADATTEKKEPARTAFAIQARESLLAHCLDAQNDQSQIILPLNQIAHIFQPLKPVIITKNEIQKKVFGLGYPSLPTMTIDEFYEQKVKEGTFSIPDMSLQTLALGGYDRQEPHEADEIQKEKQEENDDLEALQRARKWDDWKDDHRRGWGNRKNMG